MATPKISVIIPVYKVEKYLSACLDSILAQSFTDFELLLINDGSPDNSGAICDEYAKKDSRIRVFHKKNEGVSKARNLGLDNAKADWIAFIDSDDFIKIDYLKHLYKAIEDDVDLIITGHERRKEGEDIASSIFKNRAGTFTRSNIFTERRTYRILATWSKLIRRNILEEYKIRFDTNLSSHEDAIFYLELISATSNKIKLIDYIDYIYIHYKGTLSNTRHSFGVEYKLTHQKKMKYYLKILNNNLHKDLTDYIFTTLSKTIIAMYNPYALPRAERLEKLKMIYNNEALIIDNMPDKSIFKILRNNLPILDRVLYSRYNGILSILLKIRRKLRSLKSLFSKKKRSTQITEI